MNKEKIFCLRSPKSDKPFLGENSIICEEENIIEIHNIFNNKFDIDCLVKTNKERDYLTQNSIYSYLEGVFYHEMIRNIKITDYFNLFACNISFDLYIKDFLLWNKFLPFKEKHIVLPKKRFLKLQENLKNQILIRDIII